ncbi:hypothetical protein PPUTLS46_012180 [Pseudomonas putida LS46]|nr:hypothetical protein PPUTLS46_012180 [Pseudomonas putida LS46]
MRENEKVQGVDIALDLLDHEVDLFNAVTKDLKKLDNTAVRKNPFVREKLIKASNKAFSEHTKNILGGRTQRYANDVILTDRHINYLTLLDESLINAYAPFREEHSWRYNTGWLEHRDLSSAQWGIRDAESFLNGDDSFHSLAVRR